MSKGTRILFCTWSRRDSFDLGEGLLLDSGKTSVWKGWCFLCGRVCFHVSGERGVPAGGAGEYLNCIFGFFHHGWSKWGLLQRRWRWSADQTGPHGWTEERWAVPDKRFWLAVYRYHFGYIPVPDQRQIPVYLICRWIFWWRSPRRRLYWQTLQHYCIWYLLFVQAVLDHYGKTIIKYGCLGGISQVFLKTVGSFIKIIGHDDFSWKFSGSSSGGILRFQDGYRSFLLWWIQKSDKLYQLRQFIFR